MTNGAITWEDLKVLARAQEARKMITLPTRTEAFTKSSYTQGRLKADYWSFDRRDRRQGSKGDDRRDDRAQRARKRLSAHYEMP